MPDKPAECNSLQRGSQRKQAKERQQAFKLPTPPTQGGSDQNNNTALFQSPVIEMSALSSMASCRLPNTHLYLMWLHITLITMPFHADSVCITAVSKATFFPSLGRGP